jgi:septal ring factor EnvC (AmiA/AmiB activator)
MKQNLNITSIVLILLAIGIGPYLHPDAVWGARVRETGIILTDNLEVQSEPGKHGFLQKRLEKGTRVKIIRHYPGWLQILHGGEVGFIRDDARLVKIVREAPTQSKKTKKKRVAAPHPQRDKLKQQAGDIQQKIKARKAKIQNYTQKEIDTINRLHELDYELHKSSKKLSALKSAIAELDRSIESNLQLSQDLKNKMQANEHYFSKRLVALYKLNWIGQINVLASADSIQDFFLRKEALERILAHDEVVLKNLEEDRRSLNHKLSELSDQSIEKNERAKAYNQHMRRVTSDQSKRKKLLSNIRTQKSLEMAAIASLEKQAKKLNQKLAALDKQRASEEHLQKIPEKPLSAFKGLLNMPVKGRIQFSFGPYKNSKFNVINFRSGIGIAAEKGEPVRAVYGGKIVYADWFKGYGNMIIMDHGTNYHTVYAHLEDMFKKTGDIAQRGEVIGTVGETGSMSGAMLQFEIRHHGKPIDPLDWIKSG